jgi:aspartate racemase
MPDRTIGILGGMGPEATVDFFREIVKLTPAERDQDHIPVIVYSDPRIPERPKAILQGGEDPVPCLIRAARSLEKAGAGILAMPCNTAHFFLERIKPAVGIPFLDMIEETYAGVCAVAGNSRPIGLLATRATIMSGVYGDTFMRHGMQILIPEDEEQELIQESISLIKVGKYDPARQDVFERIGSRLMTRGAAAVILGCTEIPLAFLSERVSYPVVNATRILAQAAVDWALGKRA